MSDEVRKGDWIFARVWNALVAKVITSVGPGLVLRQSPNGATLALSPSIHNRPLAVVTAAPTAPVDPAPPLRAADVVYTVQVIGNEAGTIVDAVPMRDYAPNTAVYPAQVGDPCEIIVTPQADGSTVSRLRMFTEYALNVECPSE